jgi:hypothetical protein
MLRVPARFRTLLRGFAPPFRAGSWRYAEVLLVGAILAPSQRTVASILRVSGLARERRFVNYHRVLDRAAWSGKEAARVLLKLLLATFAPHGPVVLGLDDTIERRRGKRISVKGIYCDPVRSSHGHFVKASGLHWLSLMLLVPVPWAGRVWALPFLTALALSERYSRNRGRRHKRLTDWGRQLVLRCCPLRAGAATSTGNGWSSPDQGRTATNIGRSAGRPRHALAPRHGAWLVRRGGQGGGDLLRHGRLAPQRHAPGANPLGAAP